MTLFSGARAATAVPPSHLGASGSDAASLRLFQRLLARERFEFEVELGAPIEFARQPSPGDPIFLIGPSHANPSFAQLGIGAATQPAVWFDAERQLLVVDGPDLGSVAESLSLLRTMTTTGRKSVTATDCKDIDEAIERVRHEIATTYPSFSLRGIDWDDVCARHENAVQESDNPLPAMQRWIAELEDMHTWVQPDPPHGLLPYLLHATSERAVFARVPETTSAHDAGVRPGDELVGVDTADVWSRTGGPSHMRPLLTGRRLLSGPVNVPRKLQVRRTDGTSVEFSEAPTFQPWTEPVAWSELSSGTGYVRIAGFPPGVNELVDDALNDLETCDRLIVDLRGNAGGLLVEALDFRDRFITEPMQMGTIRFSSPSGGLSRHESILAEPTTHHISWNGAVRFLTDPMTASASEDALLGLQGLPHVTVFGTPTAGGSGRPRSIRLLPGMRLSVSTALTFDRSGRCVEGNGIPPDVFIPFAIDDNDDAVLQAADSGW